MNIRYKYVVSRSDRKSFDMPEVKKQEFTSVLPVNPKKIEIKGRRWYHKGPGNTYHSAEIYLDDVQVEGIKFKYGYGQAYLDSAFDQLQNAGLITPGKGVECFNNWAKRNGVELIYSCDDVKRKKDL